MPSITDNATTISFTLELTSLEKINIENPTELKARIKEYFELCSDYNIKPSPSGLALSIGLNRTELEDYLYRRNGHDNEETSKVLTAAMAMLEAILVDYVQNGLIQPATGIFLLSNNHGYQDVKKVNITPVGSPLGAIKDKAEIEKKYIESVADEI